ncbi:MAG TPA: GDSL-type esterase/lipase family protein, partial [Flavisolibacter sp.]|nr:GDSL-type esterase/lipase family protein [Flavisolibacter sp.]
MITRLQSLFFFLFCLPLLVVAQDTTTATSHLAVLTLGDSNGSFPHSWPQQLRLALPGAAVFNLSKSGRTIGFLNLGDSSLNSLLVIDENPEKAADFIGNRSFDFVVLELGTNDGKAVFANRQNEVAANLEKLIQKMKNSRYASVSKAQIIILSPPPYGSKAEATEKYRGGGKRVKKMSRAFRKVAGRNGCLFVNGYKTPGLDIETMTSDGLHLNEEGSKK